jgi:glycosyltransferase involved in cell wall biosynthesis
VTGDRLRILRVAQTCYPESTGGGAYHVHAMSRDQAARGHDVTVLTVRTAPDQPHLDHREGYTVVRYDPLASPVGNAISPGVAQYLAAGPSFDVVHAHSHLYFSTNLAALCRALAGTVCAARPLALTNHGLYSQTAPERVFDFYLRTLGRWTFDRADTVFCYTDVDRERLRDVGVTSDIAVVPNGIDTDRFSSDGLASDRLAGDPAVLFVGRLVEGKRPLDAVRAVKRLRETYPDLRLSLCGDGPRRDEIESAAGDETVLLGEQPYGEMPAIYRAADALVLPSRAEGTPRTVLEAIACGTPVACSALPHVRAVFGDAASYFEPGDIEALCEALSRELAREHGPDPALVTDWDETVRRTTEQLTRLVE